jgi:hypothetical protein
MQHPWFDAERLRRFGVSVVLVIALTGCSIQRAQEASVAQKTMVGMSKENLLACMGAPANTATAGETEVWSYNSGNGRTDTLGSATAFGGYGSATAFGTATTSSRYCKVDIVMSKGLVSRINYSGPTGGLLTKGEQCAFAVENCVPKQ